MVLMLIIMRVIIALVISNYCYILDYQIQIIAITHTLNFMFRNFQLPFVLEKINFVGHIHFDILLNCNLNCIIGSRTDFTIDIAIMHMGFNHIVDKFQIIVINSFRSHRLHPY